MIDRYLAAAREVGPALQKKERAWKLAIGGAYTDFSRNESIGRVEKAFDELYDKYFT